MKTDIKYDKSFPLRRLEKGDHAVISVQHYKHLAAATVSDKDKARYGSVPDGDYDAVCTAAGNGRTTRLECPSQPALSGSYNYWYGDRHGCTDAISADEPEHMKGVHDGSENKTRDT